MHACGDAGVSASKSPCVRCYLDSWHMIFVTNSSSVSVTLVQLSSSSSGHFQTHKWLVSGTMCTQLITAGILERSSGVCLVLSCAGNQLHAQQKRQLINLVISIYSRELKMTLYSETAMAPRVLARKVTSPKHPAGVISLQPTDQWQGNDGNWSTFAIDVGTPQQQYRLLPSTSSSQTWVPDPPQACNLGESVPDCAFRRGIDSKNVSLEQSTSWTNQGMYELSDNHGILGDVGNGTLGTDNITLNQAIPTEAGVSRQLLTAYVNSPVWMGLLGLGDDAGKLPNSNVSASGILSNLRASGQVGCRSYGYTAGAHYCKVVR